MKKTIIICGNFDFHKQNAASKYNLAYGYILKDLGYNVVFVGVDIELSYNMDIFDSKQYIHDFESYSMPYPHTAKDWFKYKKQYNKIKSIINKFESDLLCVIVFGSPAISIWAQKIYRYCEKTNISVIGHCAENVRFTRKGILYSLFRGIDDFYFKKVLLKKFDGVIVGGPLIFDYFSKRNVNTVAFPTMNDNSKKLLDIKRIIEKKKTEIAITNKRFIYVGIPFDNFKNQKPNNFKDRIDKTVELFLDVANFNSNFSFDIYGITLDEYLDKVPLHKSRLQQTSSIIKFHGKIENYKAIDEIIESDFYIFHRDKTRITEAAFPTKASESVSLGTPLITNETSYIFDYVQNGETGFILTDGTQKNLILYLLNVDQNVIIELKKKCIEQNPFDYRKFIDKFEIFFDKCTSRISL